MVNDALEASVDKPAERGRERLRQRMRHGPIPESAFSSPLHEERLAAILGISLGVSFLICFGTGLISHLLQHPQPWFHWPARPVNLYRVTQGLHVLTGIASIPLLLAKLWTVYPKLFEWPPVRGVVHAVERLSLLVLVGGSLFLLFSGVLNTAYWYSPMQFYFPAAHYWVAWTTIGALIAHIGAKATITRRVVFTRQPPTFTPATESAGLSRRGFLAAVAASSGVLVTVVAGQTARAFSSFAVLAPRRPNVGPQGIPVNRTADAAGVRVLAASPDYRLVLDRGKRHEAMMWTIQELRAMPQHDAGLPISCVEGWSASAQWTGVPLRHLLALGDLPANTRVRVESLEPTGTWRTSIVDPEHVADPDTLLALRLNGAELHPDHGYPLRLIAPNRPGVLQTKWVTRVVVL